MEIMDPFLCFPSLQLHTQLLRYLSHPFGDFTLFEFPFIENLVLAKEVAFRRVIFLLGTIDLFISILNEGFDLIESRPAAL
jgi:hypothetical protein